MSRPHFMVLSFFLVVAGCTFPAGSTNAPVAALPIPTRAPTAAATHQPGRELADCSNVTVEQAIEALRDAPSYSYLAEGQNEVWESISNAVEPLQTPSRTVLVPRRERGIYIAPDRFTEEVELVSEDDIVEARRFIGHDGWVRLVGSMRWQPWDGYDSADLSANVLLDLVQEQPNNWTGPNNSAAPGLCHFATSGSDQGVERSLTMIVEAMSAMPVDITHAIDTHRPPEWGFVTEVEMSYEISTDTVASIDEPDIDRSVMRPDDALYYFRRLFCGEGPCAPSVISQSRQDAADTFCMENVGQRVSVTFHDNGARESAGGCAGDPPPPGMPTMPPPPRPTS